MIRARPADERTLMTSYGALSAPKTPTRQPQNPISRPQIETIISRAVAGFAVLFAAQALPVVIGQFPRANPFWAVVFIIAIYGGIAALALATILRRFVCSMNTALSIAYLGALIAWPSVSLDSAQTAADRPWLWLLCTVATSTAAIAFTTWQATVYLFIAPVTYGFVRVSPSGGAKALDAAALDVIYAIILGGAVLILITVLRQAAATVDAAQATALDRYAHAVRQHATEVERVQVDSIVHDSVLTTLLSAARAYSPQEQRLTTQMALNAMGHLKDAAAASPDEDSTVTLAHLGNRIDGARSTLAVPFALRSRSLAGAACGGDAPIPALSAEAVYSATVQALVNSQQHAGTSAGVERWLSIDLPASGGIRIAVGDNGVGFTPALVPSERLGLRVSIVERVSRAGGAVSIVSAVGEGTTIFISWPGGAISDVPPLTTYSLLSRGIVVPEVGETA